MQTSSVVLCSLLAATTALGQITPDNTLGNESSLVTPNVNVKGNLADLIEGGAIRESNLFHSFSDFNVAQFGRVYFANPAGIQNIITRVTGTNISNILGTLGVQGNANLFLINPNGIVFGFGSSLDLGGSFFASTADSVLFEDGTVFSAKNPNGQPLLTIKIPSGLQYGSNPAMQRGLGGFPHERLHQEGSITTQSSLRVPNVQTLGLIGGEVTILGAFLNAPDGRIELGSVGPNSVVNLIPTDTSFVLDYSGVQEFQDISLSKRAFIFTNGESGGSIQVQGAKVSLRDRSGVFAETNGSESGGGIVVEASQLSLEGRSSISTNVTGSGQGGDVSITTGELIISDGAFVSAMTFGEGDGGNLTVDADSTVKLIGPSGDGHFSNPSSLFTETVFGTGNAGDVTITTGELIVSDGAQVSARTFGKVDGGNLTVDADSTVQVIGTSADGRFPSGLFTETFLTIGNVGDLSITTGELIIKDGAQVSARTGGEGGRGNLTVDADSTVQVIGTSADGRFRSRLFTETVGIGNGGELSITTGELIVSDGATVSTDTRREGDGGNLTVDAHSTVKVIGTSAVKLIGTSADARFPSGLFARTEGRGTGGDISISTGELIIKDGAQVLASPIIGEGDGGSLSVNASSGVRVIGTSANGQFPSALSTQTPTTGKAGNLKITTGELIVSDGAQVAAGSFDEGEGGDLIVDAEETVKVIGTSPDGRIASGLFTQTEGKGKAKDLKITTGELIVSDGAAVSAGTFSAGDGGNLTVNAEETVKVIGTSASGEFVSGFSTQANSGAAGNAGDVTLTTGKLIVSDGAVVSASSFGEGDGGNLSFEILTVEDRRIAQPNQGIKQTISIGQLIVSDGAEISTTSTQLGSSAGNLEINANSIFLNKEGIISAETAGGDKGNITLSSRHIRLLNESKITTNAENTTGGNITIDTDTLVGLGNSDITANAQQGSGGRVEIDAKSIFGLEFRDDLTPDNDITATSDLGPSFSGDVILNTPGVDPTSGLTELPASLVDAEAILANDLCGFENNRIAGGSSFTITGKGGLPPTRLDPVINTDRTVGWRTRPGLASSKRQKLQQQPNVRRPQPVPEKKVIIEAQGWVTAKDGTIILTAHPFKGTPVEQILPNLDCHSGRGKRE
ncbi:filamentous hemagglutinin N-terminal domain-containing protein [Moorena producens]|uniref:two-partner secretion domain-containing protein n=1 Tax=Moorena producens TaxID=1155739 RepID=UPI001314DB98|nr:filamentous hemagglutinin N-terminal domain-containing protein [Moorena producens]